MKQSTIAAIATPVGVGGIGVIRISGPNAFQILSSIFIPKKNGPILNSLKKNINTSMIQSHKLYYGHIAHPTQENIIDEVLVTFMKAPNTYTTENVAEIQAHSGFVSLNRLLSAVLEKGATIAEPGEFTKRAFLNGRIDLTQASGVIDLINAKTEKASLAAASLIEGSTKNTLEKLKTTMLEIQANYERTIEFAEDPDEKSFGNNEYSLIEEKLIPELDLLLKKEEERVLYQEGVSVAIVGAPNVGKSSLMNRLLEQDRSIVTDIPGTTRDVLKEHILIKNLPVILYDTAGIHTTDNTIEKIGINKSMNLMEKADIILLVVDAREKTSLSEKEIIKNYNSKKIIIIVNKIDICMHSNSIEFSENFAPFNIVKISAKENLFIDKLKRAIFEMSVNLTYEPKDNASIDTISLPLRNQLLLAKTKTSLIELLSLMDKKKPVDLFSHQLGKCIDTLSEISGSGKTNEIYEYIFSKFCIGK